MMTNLFSMFDPSNFMMKTAWMISISTILVPFLKNKTKHNNLIKKMTNWLKSEFYSSTSSNMSNNILIPIFLSIFMVNIISIIPSSFAASAQMAFILPISVPLWMMSMSFFLIKKTNKFLSHLVPSGSPNMLMPSLVVIELVSNLIRPITLSVRLVANITAGHLLMHLLSSFSCSYMNYPFSPLIFLTSMILSSLEMGVALIQSYILCTLISLYSSEIK